MSIVSSLSKLLIKMGGTPAAGDNSDELVDKIADAYSGILVVTAVENAQGFVCDKTAAEMYAAFPAIILREIGGNASLINQAYKDGDDYEFTYFDTAGMPVVYEASSGDEYPTYVLEVAQHPTTEIIGEG